jgi:hypothetical protein
MAGAGGDHAAARLRACRPPARLALRFVVMPGIDPPLRRPLS